MNEDMVLELIYLVWFLFMFPKRMIPGLIFAVILGLPGLLFGVHSMKVCALVGLVFGIVCSFIVTLTLDGFKKIFCWAFDP